MMRRRAIALTNFWRKPSLWKKRTPTWDDRYIRPGAAREFAFYALRFDCSIDISVAELPFHSQKINAKPSKRPAASANNHTPLQLGRSSNRPASHKMPRLVQPKGRNK